MKIAAGEIVNVEFWILNCRSLPRRSVRPSIQNSKFKIQN
jgi:hypothetical protein